MKQIELLHKMINACGVCWLLDPERIKNIIDEIERCQNLQGDVAEIGVFQGATALLIKTLFPNRTLHLYDTFSGIPNVDPETCKFKTGDFNCPLANVQRVLGINNVCYHVGIFPESFHEQHQRFVFVHSDTDTLEGTRATLETMFPLLVQGGVIVLDDYTFGCCPGVKIAVDDWLKTNKEKCKIKEHVMQLVVIKL